MELRFRDGARERATPVDGFLVHAVAPEQAHDGHRVTTAVALDAPGEEIGRQRLRR